ncbi:arylamine N-acetyltransferase [Asanoa ishikariensis]|uniref:Arylamine N-acetyltransferase n=1 Tax=Asanoa ishikariensis TaxID=137265 RepID=A0A1H3TJE0_9ACTN|nr:arylamine N-acetyltransferase [Asanoa ishikariensis]GIF62463.1 arylamine N-acetyltransferase [Asanoa ishikariensis]SDZ49459.1 Arylamine N-acetyltransferase [Asanoa ishikariensis]
MIDVSTYLRRLGLRAEPPSAAALATLHRAHAERIAYTTFDIHLGRTTTVDPLESADRIARLGRGGYCYHLNGAMSALLTELGYDVRWHVGGVQGHAAAEPVGANGNHLVLTVHGLPTPECPAGVWFADVGLGDGLHAPVPLTPGSFEQGPYAFHLGHSAVEPDGWRLTHAPFGAFVGMDFRTAEAMPADFAAMHVELTTSPESGFVRTLTAQRRHVAGADILRGLTLTTVSATGIARRDVTNREEWWAMLAGLFNLGLDDVTAEERTALWDRVRATHEARVAA